MVEIGDPAVSLWQHAAVVSDRVVRHKGVDTGAPALASVLGPAKLEYCVWGWGRA